MTSKLVEKLDRVFSEYIRKRDADENGYGHCVSCGVRVHWSEADCGHYISRHHMATRWNVYNCHLQCKRCNTFDDGSKKQYSMALQKKYGNKIIGKLNDLKNSVVKYSDADLKELIEQYTVMLKNM